MFQERIKELRKKAKLTQKQVAEKLDIHGVAEGRTRLSDFTSTFHFHALEKEMAAHSSVLA